MFIRSALLSATWVATLALGATAQVPSLSHTAPQIGNPLSIALAGSTPGASVRLFFSPGETSVTTPYGTLELERSGMVLLASGPANSQGLFAHQQMVPPDPALAETWGHYQALVQDASAPSGWVLSEAVHLRYLSTRLYETSIGFDTGSEVHPAELRVVSLPSGNSVDVLQLAAGTLPSPWLPTSLADGEPVFSANLAFGAVVPSSDRLVVFDNFRMEVLAILPLQSASMHLLRGVDGQSAVVLEAGPPPRILWVDLPTGNVTTNLSWPGPLEPRWVAPGGAARAWVGESEPSGRIRLREIDLVNRQVLGAIAIGPDVPASLVELAGAQDRVFATTRRDGWTPGGLVDALSTIDLGAAPPSMVFVEFNSTATDALTPLANTGLLLLSTQWTGGPSSANAYAAPFPDPLDLRLLPQPPSYLQGNTIEYAEFHGDIGGFWALHPCCDWDGGSGSVMHYTFSSNAWTEIGSFGLGGPNALALARDGFTYQVAVALDGLAGWSPPTLELLEVATSAFTSIPGSWNPIALHALTVP